MVRTLAYIRPCWVLATYPLDGACSGIAVHSAPPIGPDRR